MGARSWRYAIAGTAAVLVAAGCSSSTASVEPEPGELDYDIAVTRTAVQFAATPGELEYNPWAHEMIELGGDFGTVRITDELEQSGLDILCGSIAGGGMSESYYFGAVAQEAVHGAVLASASKEFRDSYSAFAVSLGQADSRDEDGGEPDLDAFASLTDELMDEWVELYEMQVALEQEALTVEGARAAQAAASERCGVTLDDADVTDEPAAPINPRLLSEPRR
ncbi:hypothetical protein [Demequina aestuarii]|uniref:hypothetical protein n=1 Tax=Demequina aestuarii TaxID=327095 RepID=UPI000781B7F2|nr:hypothetical protein [Demequina aestuarii]